MVLAECRSSVLCPRKQAWRSLRKFSAKVVPDRARRKAAVADQACGTNSRQPLEALEPAQPPYWPLSRFIPCRLLALNRTPDDQLWDFAESSRLYGALPKIVWLRCGNSTPPRVEAILRRNTILMIELIQNPDLHYIEII